MERMTGIDESLRFVFDKARASTPRADASLRSDQNSPLGCFALSGLTRVKSPQTIANAILCQRSLRDTLTLAV